MHFGKLTKELILLLVIENFNSSIKKVPETNTYESLLELKKKVHL